MISAWSLKCNISRFATLITFSLAFLYSPLFGQDEKKVEAEKTAPRMSLASTQINGDTILLEASVKVKRDGSWQPVDFEPVKFDVHNDSVTISIGKALTSDKGIASLKVDRKQLVTDADGLWMFGSVFGGNAVATEGDAELTVRAGGVTLVGEEMDTVNSLTFKLFAPGPENLPIADAEVGFFVKRHFSNLKIGEGTTDENGEVTIECPKDLPGDINGNLVLIGRADDLEEYGSVSAVVEKPWGIALPEDDHKKTRELWSHSPPLWMIIVFAILMTTVWGHYIVIIYKLVKIRNPKTS